MEHHDRHCIVWALVRPIAKLLTKLKLNYSCPVYDIPGPYIVMCNHTTDWDPIMLGAAFKNHMYFVASEHIMRKGFASKLLAFFQPTINRMKGGSAVSTVKSILRELKAGNNVALFPEGNRTWDGVTRPFPESTGKMVRSSGAALVTFKIKGGYFTSPRWAGSDIRKGETYGELVKIYSPEDLKLMTADQINRAIAADLYEDAYETQRKVKVRFEGATPAMSLETFLFICPVCGRMHKMRSYDDKFFCGGCGTELRYTQTGFFTGNKVVFNNVLDWSRWQSEKIRELCENAGDLPIFEDSRFSLFSVEPGCDSELLGSGSIHLFADRLELPGDIVIPICEITGMAMRGAINLYIGTANGSNFELKSEEIRCTEKYIEACSILGSPIGCAV